VASYDGVRRARFAALPVKERVSARADSENARSLDENGEVGAALFHVKHYSANWRSPGSPGPPALHGAPAPYGFDNAKGPCTLQEAVQRGQQTGGRERENKVRAALLQCLEHKHESDGEQAEQGKTVHRRTLSIP
jgi:hypothetical protein